MGKPWKIPRVEARKYTYDEAGKLRNPGNHGVVEVHMVQAQLEAALELKSRYAAGTKHNLAHSPNNKNLHV
jgi:hypothetical protein